MHKYLVCNVSDQTIPTVLFINEMKLKYEIEKIFFIVTNYSLDKMKNIIAACPDINEKYTEIVLPCSDSIREIKKFLDISFDKPVYSEAKFFVDISCGTKIMSVSVYEFFKEYTSEIFYINAQKESYRKVYPGNQREEMKFTYKIPLDAYLKAYGVEIKKSKETCYRSELLNNFFKLYENLDNRKILGLVRRINNEEHPNNRNTPYFRVNSIPGLKLLCNCLEIHDELLTTKQIEYLSGVWFEEYLFNWLKEVIFESRVMSCNIVNKVNNVPNELDLAFIYKNSLYIIEAKTNMQGKRGLEKDTLYKSKALEKNFGLRTNTIIATLDKDLPQKKSFLNRAELMGVDLMFEDDLKPVNILSNLKKRFGE